MADSKIGEALEQAAVPLFLAFYEEQRPDLVEILRRRLAHLIPPSAGSLDELLQMAGPILRDGPHADFFKEAESALRAWELEDPEGARAYWDGTAGYVPWDTPSDLAGELYDLVVWEMLNEPFRACAQELFLPFSPRTLRQITSAIVVGLRGKDGRRLSWLLRAQFTAHEAIPLDEETKFRFEAPDWKEASESLDEAEERIHAAFRAQLSAWRDAHRSRLFRPTRPLNPTQQRTVRDLRWLALKQTGLSYGQIAMREKAKPGTVRSAVLRTAKRVGLEQVRTAPPGRPRKR